METHCITHKKSSDPFLEWKYWYNNVQILHYKFKKNSIVRKMQLKYQNWAEKQTLWFTLTLMQPRIGSTVVVGGSSF